MQAHTHSFTPLAETAAPRTTPRFVIGIFAGALMALCAFVAFTGGEMPTTASATDLWTDAVGYGISTPAAFAWVYNWTLEDAFVDAQQRVAAMPNASRYYTPGLASLNESFCTSNNENKFCNHNHGSWGDAIPQTEEWCAWSILEFQDAPQFDYVMGSTNYNAFISTFGGVVDSISPWVANGSVYMGATASQYGGGDVSTPWPVSSVIWRYGNKYSKWWIGTNHRPSAQCEGLAWGFTFHGHFKAVKCADVDANLAKMGVSNSSYSAFGTSGVNNFMGDAVAFRNYWNAYAITKDYYDELAGAPDTCTIGPCNNSTQCDPTDN